MWPTEINVGAEAASAVEGAAAATMALATAIRHRRSGTAGDYGRATRKSTRGDTKVTLCPLVHSFGRCPRCRACHTCHERSAASDLRETSEGHAAAAVDESERHELVQDLVDALAARGVPEGARLLDLMRLERSLQDALRFVRQEIDAVVRSSEPPPL